MFPAKTANVVCSGVQPASPKQMMTATLTATIDSQHGGFRELTAVSGFSGSIPRAGSIGLTLKGTTRPIAAY